ncbi:Retrovirus-related Pol polyprotein from transposon TNT 1-94 [Rhizoctonia solani]|uniref:Retrovirus-related Pol polyprotein from transposon TNT 1-94 n=1 Tax=Rhizoctonia solani TaxID=456999 RepID=A0A8H8P230_9AGAM|nr:Retrovirus-related Pol polyprotein from transposon TNT 1-94 [Rhizoctonia solani]QRW22950.1 Retrovirus-related Pol polyprotein from transposon TNT 1-94 [Rhizoctonia solani]
MLVFTINVDGTYKLGLVIKERAQQLGCDYKETFPPVTQSASICLVVGIALQTSLTIYAANFTVAFLNGELKEEICMEQLEGWSALPKDQKSYLKVVQTLYGLGQAGCLWYKCLSTALADLEFVCFNSDNCVFMPRRKDTGLILIAVHVNNLTGATSNDSVWSQFCDELNAKHELKNLGRAKELLGLEITQDSQTGTASITQTRYIEELAKQYNVSHLPPLSLPLLPRQKFSKVQCPTLEEEKVKMKGVPYLALVAR